MAVLEISNFASGQLLNSVDNTATLLQLVSGGGDNFPNPTSPNVCKVVVEDDQGNKEITHMTSRAGDNLTVVRGQEATTPKSFAAGSRVELRVTAETLMVLDSGEW